MTKELIKRLKELGDKSSLPSMKRFGINVSKAFGVRIPELRKLAKEIGMNHKVAIELWESGYHEARILASMIADPKLISKEQMTYWAHEFNSWDLCDQVCNNLFVKTPFAYPKAIEWSNSDQEFVKRAGFTLMACLAVHDKKLSVYDFEPFIYQVMVHAIDERNFVKKAVNWALRQIGKRNIKLNEVTIRAAEELAESENSTAKWIAADALKELKSEKIIEKLKNK